MKRLKIDISPQEDDCWKEAVKGVQKITKKEEPPSKQLIINEVNRNINYQTA